VEIQTEKFRDPAISATARGAILLASLTQFSNARRQPLA
jgi:hypothetical protein